MSNLKETRNKINEIDRHLVELISERVTLGKEVAEAKRSHGDSEPVYFQPPREQEVLNTVAKLNPGVIDNDRLKNIFREIMGATIRTQTAMKVAYLGPEGTYSHEAAQKKFSHSLQLVPCKDFYDIFDMTQKRLVQYGVVPIENRIEGIVNRTLDLLLEFDVKIYSEVYVPVEHHLAGFANSLEQIKKIYTHDQARNQCWKWLRNHLPQAEVLEVSSTAKGAEMVAAQKDPSAAAICSIEAAEKSSLSIIANQVQNYEKNFTRFIVIGHEAPPPSEKDRTSFICAVAQDQPGSLFQILGYLNEAKINMSSIESRPSVGQLWKYTFYINIDGHRDDEVVKKTLTKIEQNSSFFRILGSYPVDVD